MRIKQKDFKKHKDAQKKSKQMVSQGDNSFCIPNGIANFFDKKKYTFRLDKLHIPIGIEEEFQKYAQESIKNKRFNADNPAWPFVMSFILSYVRYNQLVTKYEEVRLSTALIYHFFGKDACHVVSFLKNKGYLKLINSFSKQARRCNGYFISDEWMDKKLWKPYKPNGVVKNCYKYKDFKKKLFEGLVIREDKIIAKLVNDVNFDSCVKRKVKNDNSKIKERINSKHKNGRMDAAGRFHTVFTNIPKSIRRKMKFCSKKLIEIDVASCQPVLLAALYGNNKKTESGKTLYFEKEKLSKSESLEKRKFIELCQSSFGFYESLGITKASFGFTLFGHLSGKAWFGLKMIKQLKERGFHILVGRLYAIRESLRSYKKDGSPSYALMARVMQRWESFIMIDQSLSNMEFGAIPIHDAVIVKEEYHNQAMKIIADSFAKFLGIRKTVFKVLNFRKEAIKRYVFSSDDAINEWKKRQNGDMELIYNN